MKISNIHAHVHFEAARIPSSNSQSFNSLVEFLKIYQELESEYDTITYAANDLLKYLEYEPKVDETLVFCGITGHPKHLKLSLDEYGQSLNYISKNLVPKKHGLVSFIPCIERYLPESHAEQVLEFCLKHKFKGIGLAAGPEKPNPPNKYKDVLKSAKVAGLQLILHSGEEPDTADHIEQCLELNVDRIGHGVQLFVEKRQDLILECKKRSIPFDFCPISNLKMGFVNKFPSREIIQSGVDFTINSDDPYIFGAGLRENIEVFEDHLYDLAQTPKERG